MSGVLSAVLLSPTAPVSLVGASAPVVLLLAVATLNVSVLLALFRLLDVSTNLSAATLTLPVVAVLVVLGVKVAV